MKEKVAEVDF